MQIEHYKKACKKLSDINNELSKYLVIHYSCESFFNIPNGASPRIVAIAIRNVYDGQTDSFSIHKTAEQQGLLSLDSIAEKYDEIELAMLAEYMDYIKNHQNYFFIHWNMRDSNYGFKAIEHRYLVLQNRFPNDIPIQKVADTSKIDLPLLLAEKYGRNYIEDPQMPKLIEKNNLNPRNFLSGQEEALGFNAQKYSELHLSTLSKTRVIDNILSLAIENKLKTNSSWIETHGYTPQSIWTLINERWYTALLVWICSFLLGRYGNTLLDYFTSLLSK